MDQLELKLASELPSTAKVVACRFPFPTWVPEHTAGEGIDTVWVYDARTFKAHTQNGMTRRTAAGHWNTPDSHTWMWTLRSCEVVILCWDPGMVFYSCNFCSSSHTSGSDMAGKDWCWSLCISMSKFEIEHEKSRSLLHEREHLGLTWPEWSNKHFTSDACVMLKTTPGNKVVMTWENLIPNTIKWYSQTRTA